LDFLPVKIERVCHCEALFAEAIPTQAGKSCFQEIASLAGERSLAMTPLFWVIIFSNAIALGVRS